MHLFETVSVVFLGLVIFDLCFLGFLPWLFRIHPPFRGLLKEGILINDKTVGFSVNWFGSRFKSIILTKKHLIIRNSYLTSIANIDINSIKSYSLKKKVLRKNAKKLVINLNFENEERELKFITDVFEDWDRLLTEVGIEKI